MTRVSQTQPMDSSDSSNSHMRISDEQYFRSCVAKERHLAQLLGRDVQGQLAAHRFVHHRAQVEDLHRFIERDVAHEDAPVLLLPHQPRFFQHAKGLAHGAARHTQSIGQRGFVELVAGHQFALHDAALNFLLHD